VDNLIEDSTQNKKASKLESLLICNNILAGDESDGWHPLLEDFIFVARKLEKLGFVYHRGNVIVTEPEEKV
jgi:hypothetical protein